MNIDPKIHQLQSNKSSLNVLHKQLNHLNFLGLKKYLIYHNICYTNDESIYNSYKKVKATKYYNHISRKKVKKPYQFVHTNFFRQLYSWDSELQDIFSCLQTITRISQRSKLENKRANSSKTEKCFMILLILALAGQTHLKTLIRLRLEIIDMETCQISHKINDNL